MDFDPRITSDVGSGYGAEHGWDCNFNFGYGHDVIDEDAESEKCCAQALRFMIAKADAEIHDLEDELAILQCQLKWAKSDKQRDPFEVCCSAFKKKIDSLTSSIQSLRNGNATGREVTDEALEIHRPAERIYDIINALVSRKFSEFSEQQATSLESSIESEKQKAVAERTEKPELTISEESSSDAARYAVQDTKEGRDMGKSDDGVTQEAELDAYRCTSEEKTRFLTFNHVMTPTYLPASTNEGNSKLGASQQGESEKYITKSETGESGSLPLSAELIVKVEEDDYDINIQQVAVNSLSKLQDHESYDPLEDHLKVTENQSQSVINAQITYGRKKPNLSSVLKPKGQKVHRKLHSKLGVVKKSNPTLPGKIRNKRSPSNAENSTQSSSPSKKDGKFLFLQETNMQRKVGIEEDIVHANASQVSDAKRRQIQGPGKESRSIWSPVETVSEEEPLSTRAISVSPHLDPDSSTNQHGFGHKSAIVEDLPLTEIPSPSYDLKNLRLKLSQDPEFLKKLKVPELKEIMRKNKLHGLSKYKKEKIIEELTKRLHP